jgi:hypothetical protein
LQAVKPGKVIARNIQNGHVIEKEAQFSAWLQKHEVNQARDALLRVGGLVEDLRTKAQQASSELPASSVVRTEVDRLEQQLTFAVSRYNDQKFLVERMERESALLGSSDELILVDPKSLERSFTDPWF